MLIEMIASRLKHSLLSRLRAAWHARRAARVRARSAASDGPARLYAFGSSSCELFDYIFGSSSRYRSHWASGWSARGFLKAENRQYVMACLQDAASTDIIFLQYGNTDMQFNAAHRVGQGNFLDPAGFCAEAAEGLLKMVETLQAAGFGNIYCIYAGPPAPVPPNYYRKRFGLPTLPVRFQVQLFREMNRLVAQKTALLDLSDVLADKRGILKPQFCRPFPDHHADYIAIQELVWERIRGIPGMPPRRPEWRRQLYAHLPRPIRKLQEQSNFAPTDIAAREARGLHRGVRNAPSGRGKPARGKPVKPVKAGQGKAGKGRANKGKAPA